MTLTHDLRSDQRTESGTHIDVVVAAGRAAFFQTQVVDGEGDPAPLGHADLPVAQSTVGVQVGVVGRRDSPRGGVQHPSTHCGRAAMGEGRAERRETGTG